MTERTQTKYSLGSDDPEIARLDLQAASFDVATRLLLRSAGIRPGMRVLDLGTGPGHVALAAAELVGTCANTVCALVQAALFPCRSMKFGVISNLALHDHAFLLVLLSHLVDDHGIIEVGYDWNSAVLLERPT